MVDEGHLLHGLEVDYPVVIQLRSGAKLLGAVVSYDTDVLVIRDEHEPPISWRTRIRVDAIDAWW